MENIIDNEILNALLELEQRVVKKPKSAVKMACLCFYRAVFLIKDDILFLQRDTKYGKNYVNVSYDKFTDTMKNIFIEQKFDKDFIKKVIEAMLFLDLMEEDSYKNYRFIRRNDNRLRVILLNRRFTEAILNEIGGEAF